MGFLLFSCSTCFGLVLQGNGRQAFLNPDRVSRVLRSVDCAATSAELPLASNFSSCSGQELQDIRYLSAGRPRRKAIPKPPRQFTRTISQFVSCVLRSLVEADIPEGMQK